MINSKTTALLFAMLSLGGMAVIPGLSLASTTTQTAYAQPVDAQEIVGGVLDDIFGDDEEDDEDTTDQSIEQPIDQENNQEIDQSETNDQSNTNTQTQTGVIDQDIEQGIQDGDDSAKSSSESGDAKKGSSSSSSSGDAENSNQQGATNDARLQQLQVQNVDQNNFAEFGDDTADQDAANVAIPIAVPINVDENNEEEDNGEDENLVLVCERQGGENSPIGNVLLIPEGEEPPEGFSQENCDSRDPGNGGD
jgi:hypothetical protein